MQTFIPVCVPSFKSLKGMDKYIKDEQIQGDRRVGVPFAGVTDLKIHKDPEKEKLKGDDSGNGFLILCM